MCFLKPIRVKKVLGDKVELASGRRAVLDKDVKIKKNDMVLVYGDLVIDKIRQ